MHLPDLSKADLLTILDIVEECHLTSADGSLDRVMSLLRELVPYEMALIGVASLQLEVGSAPGIWNFGFDQEWLRVYQQRRYERIDPVVRLALSTNASVSWQDVVAGERPIDRDLLALKLDFGHVYGLTCGNVEQSGQKQATLITLSLSREAPAPRFHRILERVTPHLRALCLGAHRDPSEPVPELTERELEILRWVKEGKSSWVIGEILSISERTVKFHVASVFRKLDVSSRPQAIAKALHFGLLNI